jgi:lipopolysaccharide transport system ATP-binding protein
MKPIIEVRGLSKRYAIGRRQAYGSLREEITEAVLAPFSRLFSGRGSGAEAENEVWALKDISFDVMEGDVVGIIGRNGAGKSTLLKILSRITEPTEGRALMRGRVASLLEVGTGFHPELTGRENIFLNGALLGMRSNEIKARLDEMIAFSEIEKFIDTPVKRYSSGMYVRLAFAVAAHLEPEILIVDEVLAVGDSAFQRKCLGKMGDVARGGRTVLFVSHNMGAVQRLCRKAMLLKEGGLESCGNTEDVVNAYVGASCPHKTKTDIYNIRRGPGFGHGIRLSSCRLFNSQTIETDTLRFGEGFTVEVECRGLERLNGLQFAVGVDSAMGERISTVLSPGGERAFDIDKGEVKKGALRIDFCLNPGMYSITIGVRSATKGYDQIANALTFHVDPAMDKCIVGDDFVHYGFVHILKPEWVIS